MKYVVIADHIAHGAADLLDLATHPEETKAKAKEFSTLLKNTVSKTADEIKKDFNG